MSALKLKLKGQNEKVEKVTPSRKQFEENVDNIVDIEFGNKEKQENDHYRDHIREEEEKERIQARPRRVNKRKKVNRYFYKVTNHHELFKIGRSFYKDYMSGMKSFAITSTGYQTSQQKTILGLASFFDHKEDLKIGIISDNLHTGAFKEIVGLSKNVQNDFFGEEYPLNVYSFYNHFEFLDVAELLEISNNPEIGDYDETLDQIVDLYDIVFWDVPELHKIQVDSERYFPLIMKFESISIIVAQSLTKKSDVDDIKKFFLGYGINLKGLLLEEKINRPKEEKTKEKVKTESAKKPWWRFFSK